MTVIHYCYAADAEYWGTRRATPTMPADNIFNYSFIRFHEIKWRIMQSVVSKRPTLSQVRLHVATMNILYPLERSAGKFATVKRSRILYWYGGRHIDLKSLNPRLRECKRPNSTYSLKNWSRKKSYKISERLLLKHVCGCPM